MVLFDKGLKQYFNPESLNKLAYIPVGLLMLFTASQISIPIKPVPITLQTVAVLLIALTYERQIALVTIISYISLGIMGAPMFANFSGGIQTILGPTGGYIIGFAAAIWILTLPIFDKFKHMGFTGMLLVSMVGQVVIYTFGLVWLGNIIGYDKALALGLYPYILPGIVKCGLLSWAVKAFRKSA